MNKPSKLACALVACMVAPLAFSAQSEQPSDKMQKEAPKFEELDKNADGRITTSEAQGTWLADKFTVADANRDGNVTRTEYETIVS